MQISLLALWLSGIILCAPSGAGAQPAETPTGLSKQAEIHSVVVDMPDVVDLSGASPDSWATLPPVRTEDRALEHGLEVQANDNRPPAS
jgi:hypothetical protein